MHTVHLATVTLPGGTTDAHRCVGCSILPQCVHVYIGSFRPAIATHCSAHTLADFAGAACLRHHTLGFAEGGATGVRCRAVGRALRKTARLALGQRASTG